MLGQRIPAERAALNRAVDSFGYAVERVERHRISGGVQLDRSLRVCRSILSTLQKDYATILVRPGLIMYQAKRQSQTAVRHTSEIAALPQLISAIW